MQDARRPRQLSKRPSYLPGMLYRRRRCTDEYARAAPGMTQQQLDSLVDAISNRVVEKLKHEGASAVKPAEPTRAAAGDDDDDIVSAQAVDFVARAKLVLSAYPELWRNLTRIPGLLDASASGGRGTDLFLIMLAGAIAVALGSEAVLRRSLDGLRCRLAAAVVGAKRFLTLLGLAGLDALGVACVFIVSYGVIGYWFPGSDAQARLAAAVLGGVFYWRFYTVVFRIFCRPGLPAARLVPLDDVDARAVYFRLSTLTASLLAIRIIMRILIAIEASPDAIAAARVFNAFLILGLLLWASWRRLGLPAWVIQPQPLA